MESETFSKEWGFKNMHTSLYYELAEKYAQIVKILIKKQKQKQNTTVGDASSAKL